MASCRSPRTGWTIIGQQTLFGQRDNLPGPGQSLWNDGWDGYAAARGRLLQSLQRAANPVLFGGDMHENWVGHVKADYSRPDSAAIGVEFCGTSITSRTGGKARWPSAWPRTRTSSSPMRSARAMAWPSSRPRRLTTTLRVVDDVTRRTRGSRPWRASRSRPAGRDWSAT